MIEQSSAAKALAAAEFWQTPKDALYSALDSGPNGLSQVEAGRRLAIFRANRASSSQSRSVLRRLG
ncbi:cation-transporting P-type ATPase [Bradyrhizobium sp. LA2.1]|uniref:cation-transporting P-type ATPase n=1 Tax=Bradyrhizobium sp. LA2.1 TaxID=3156376 RepID=UPI0033958B32